MALKLQGLWIFQEFHFFCRCFLAEAAPVTSLRAWLEFLSIEDDLGTWAFRFFKKSSCCDLVSWLDLSLMASLFCSLSDFYTCVSLYTSLLSLLSLVVCSCFFREKREHFDCPHFYFSPTLFLLELDIFLHQHKHILVVVFSLTTIPSVFICN